MATYSYRCRADGVVFDRSAPIGTATEHSPCPVCAGSARRVITAPMLSLAPRPLVRALDQAARSADAPEVVTTPPPRPRRRVPAGAVHPGVAKLPRP